MDELTSEFVTTHEHGIALAVALLLGALVGLQQGWQARDKKAGERIAGIRTYSLVGLLGGIAALLNITLSNWAFPVILLALAGISLASFQVRAAQTHNFSITSMVGLLITFCFGAIAVAVDIALAAAIAVIITIILDNREEIHGLLNRLHAKELDAGLKLLLISVVALPLLPNESLGPGGALNPREIWWMVVLIASVSFIGYFAIRVVGTEKGILFTSLFAGLSSSTALTLHFARQSRQAPDVSPLFAAGILIACGTMFPRILVYCMIISPQLIADLILPVSVMALALYLPALWIWLANRNGQTIEQPALNQNPLDLKSALYFGLLLTFIMVLGEWLEEAFGDAGIYALSATSGVADVDAITLSLTRMSQDTIDPQTAVMGIVIAAAVNNIVKSGIAAGIGTRALGSRVVLPMTLSMLAGLLIAWLAPQA